MKPASMSVKEWLIKKLAIRILIPEKVINVVITDQFDQANDALNTNDQVEISGFGKYIFNRKKAIKRMEDYLVIKEDLERRLASYTSPSVTKSNCEAKLEILLINIKILKTKLNETK